MYVLPVVLLLVCGAAAGAQAAPQPSREDSRVMPTTRSNDQARTLVLQPDGKLVVAGASDSPTQNSFALARYQPDGSPDIGFGNAGRLTTTVGSNGDMLGDLALQNDGKIVVVSSCANTRHTNIALLRYNPDGSLDPTFAQGGKVTTRIGSGIVGQ